MPKGMRGFQKGDLNPAKTPTAKQRMSMFKKGVPQSLAIRKKRARTMKRLLKDPEMRKKWSMVATGRKHSEETKKKMSHYWETRPKMTSTLKHKLDCIFSKYIRLKYSINGRVVACFTCERTFPVPEMDNGHYVSRQFLATRYSEENCHPQCRLCNRFNEGSKDEYTIKLIQKYGSEILNKLNTEKKQIVKYFPYEEKIKHYKLLVKQIIEEHDL